MKLADYLDQKRLGLVFNDKSSKNAEFIIEDMNKESAEVFSKLQLERYIPDGINFLLDLQFFGVNGLDFLISYKLGFDISFCTLNIYHIACKSGKFHWTMGKYNNLESMLLNRFVNELNHSI